MSPLKSTLLTAQSWLHRHLLLLIIVTAVLADLCFVVYSYYAGQARQLQLNGAPALKARQIKQLQREVDALITAQARSRHQADSAYARAQVPEQDAARRQVIITHLTTRYYALTTDTITTTAATDYLRHYAPGPDAQL